MGPCESTIQLTTQPSSEHEYFLFIATNRQDKAGFHPSKGWCCGRPASPSLGLCFSFNNLTQGSGPEGDGVLQVTEDNLRTYVRLPVHPLAF